MLVSISQELNHFVNTDLGQLSVTKPLPKMRLIQSFLSALLLSLVCSAMLLQTIRAVHVERNLKRSESLKKFQHDPRTASHQAQSKNCAQNVCFLLQDTASVTLSGFNAQIESIRNISTALFDRESSKIAVYRYGAMPQVISEPTFDVEPFLSGLNSSTRQGERSLSKIMPTMARCFFGLRPAPDMPTTAVIFMNEYVYHGNFHISLERAEERFRRTGGKIIVVSIGKNSRNLVNEVFGSPVTVASASSYTSISTEVITNVTTSLALSC